MTYGRERVKVGDVIIDFSRSHAYLDDSSDRGGDNNTQLQSVELDEKSLLLFRALLNSDNRQASRKELIECVWQGNFASDDSLTNLVSQTRARIKQISHNNIIKTLPKKGYGLKGQVTELSEGVSHSGVVQQKNPTKKIWMYSTVIVFLTIGLLWLFDYEGSESEGTIAVLPISAFSDTPEIVNSAFSFTEELTHQLTNYPALRVVSRTLASGIDLTKLTHQELSEKLNSRYFVEGSVRESEDSLRFTLQLIEGQSGMHVFSHVVETTVEQFNKEKEQIIQRISRLVVSEVPFNIVGTSEVEKQIYIERCESYLEIAFMYADGILTNIEAIAPQAEPACLAVSQVSDEPSLLSKPAELYLFMAQGSVKERKQRLAYIALGRKYVEQGLAQRPEDEELLDKSLKLWNFELLDALNYNSDPQNAFQHLVETGERALQLYPGNSNFVNTYAVAMRRYGVFQARKGLSPVEYFDKGIKLFEQGITLFPDNTTLIHNLGRLYKSYASYLVDSGDEHRVMLEKSIRQYEETIAKEPEMYDAYVNIGNAYSSLTKWLAQQNLPYLEALNKARFYYGKTIEKFEKKQQVHNNLASLNSVLAKIELWRGQRADDVIQEGIDEANSALAIQPDYIWPHFNLMNLYYHRQIQDYALKENGISAGQQCTAIAAKGHELKDNLASTWHTMAQCGQLIAKIHIEAGRTDAALRLLNEIDGWIEHAIKINSKDATGYQVSAINQLLKARIARPSSEEISTTIGLFLKALELRPDSDDIQLTALEAFVFFNSIDSDLAADLGSSVRSQMEDSDKQEVSFQLLTLLLEMPLPTKTQWQDAILKHELKHGLLADLYGRQYSYLVSPD